MLSHIQHQPAPSFDAFGLRWSTILSVGSPTSHQGGYRCSKPTLDVPVSEKREGVSSLIHVPKCGVEADVRVLCSGTPLLNYA